MRHCKNVLWAVVALALIAAATYQTRPYTPGETAGTIVTDDVRTLTVLESALTHYDGGSDPLVDKGDPVLLGDEGIVGVALKTASANTDYVVVQVGGIWNLMTTNTAAMSFGDAVYIHSTSGELSDSPTNGLLFGYLLSAITGTGSPVVRPIWVIGATRDFAATASDLSVTGDLYVGDDADITGDLRVDSTIGSSSTITGADVHATDDVTAADDARTSDDLTVGDALSVVGASALAAVTASGAIIGNSTLRVDSTSNLQGTVTAQDINAEDVTTSGSTTVGTNGTQLDDIIIFSGTLTNDATSVAVTIAGALPSKTYAVVVDTSGTAGSGKMWAPYLVKVETGAADICVTSASASVRTFRGYAITLP